MPHSLTRSHRTRIVAVLAVIAMLGVLFAAPFGAQAQGTPECPIRILMYDALILRVSPSYGAAASTTLVKDNSVCLVGRTNDAAWVQVAGLPPNSTVLGWAPAGAFWTTVPITVLPVVTGPVPTPVPPTPIPPTTVPGTPPPTQTTYTIQAGDTVYSIAQRFGVTIPALVQANNIPADYRIYIGQVLVIPGTTPPPTPPPTYTTYTVQPGDYLVKIARQFNIHWSAIAAANNIAPPYIIFSGQQLLIPAAG